MSSIEQYGSGSVLNECFTGILEKDFFYLFCEERIGRGAYRDVWTYRPDPKKFVVKIETGSQSFSNIKEWELWRDVQFYEPAAKWLAPCERISPCGIIMIQRRTLPLKAAPDKVPVWMTDLKKSNFGRMGGRIVAHDYAANLVANTGAVSRLKKARWTDD